MCKPIEEEGKLASAPASELDTQEEPQAVVVPAKQYIHRKTQELPLPYIEVAARSVKYHNYQELEEYQRSWLFRIKFLRRVFRYWPADIRVFLKNMTHCGHPRYELCGAPICPMCNFWRQVRLISKFPLADVNGLRGDSMIKSPKAFMMLSKFYPLTGDNPKDVSDVVDRSKYQARKMHKPIAKTRTWCFRGEYFGLLERVVTKVEVPEWDPIGPTTFSRAIKIVGAPAVYIEDVDHPYFTRAAAMFSLIQARHSDYW